MSLIRSIYRTVLSDELRTKIYNRKNIKRDKKLLKEIISFLGSKHNNFPEKEIAEIISFLKDNGLHVFPYEFSKKYKPENIEVIYDKDFGLHYVMHSGKKLYFKKDW